MKKKILSKALIFQVGDVCWSDPEEKEDPTAGCLDKPVPGTYRSDIRTDAVGSSRIINGDEISIAKHPWYVYYSIKDNGFCGGTVISKYLGKYYSKYMNNTSQDCWYECEANKCSYCPLKLIYSYSNLKKVKKSFIIFIYMKRLVRIT